MTASDGTLTDTATVSVTVTYRPSPGAETDAFTYTISDGHGGSAMATVSVTVVEPVASTVTLSASPASVARLGTVTLTVAVPKVGDVVPTGQVKVSNGGQQVATGLLVNGSVKLSFKPTSAGVMNLTASYIGDKNNLAVRAPGRTLKPTRR